VLDRDRLHQRHRRADRVSQLKESARPAASTRCRPDFFAQAHAIALHAALSVNPAALALGRPCFVGLLVLGTARGVFATPAMSSGSGEPSARALDGAHQPGRPDGSRIPGPIVALVTLSIAAGRCWRLPVETIGTRFGGIPRAAAGVRLARTFDWESVQRLFVSDGDDRPPRRASSRCSAPASPTA
jgi:hypothetical protein